MAKSVTPFLMFEGAAEAAANLYVSVFRDSAIHSIERYGPGEDGPEGTVRPCHLVVAGLPLRFFDSPIQHGFTFTPSISLFVDCESEAELDAAFAQLSDGGEVHAPGQLRVQHQVHLGQRPVRSVVATQPTGQRRWRSELKELMELLDQRDAALAPPARQKRA